MLGIEGKLQFRIEWDEFDKKIRIGPNDWITKSWLKDRIDRQLTYENLLRSLYEDVKDMRFAVDPKPGEAVRPTGVITPKLLAARLKSAMETAFPEHRGSFDTVFGTKYRTP